MLKHFEIQKILNLIQKKYFWLVCAKQMKTYIQTYNVCQCIKIFRHKFYEELNSLSVLEVLWKEIFINFIIDLSSSKRKNVVYITIFVIVNKCTNWLNIYQWSSRSTLRSWQNYFSKKSFYTSTYQQILLMIKTFYSLMLSDQRFVIIQKLNVD